MGRRLNVEVYKKYENAKVELFRLTLYTFYNIVVSK